MKIVRIVLSIICFLIAAIFVIVFFTMMAVGSEDWKLALGIATVFLAAGLLLVEREVNRKMKQKIRGLRGLIAAEANIIEGLPIPVNDACMLMLRDGSLVIEGGGSTFVLPISQVREIGLKTDSGMTNFFDKWNINKRSSYLMINYMGSKNEVATMKFKVGSYSLTSMKNLVMKLQNAIASGMSSKNTTKEDTFLNQHSRFMEQVNSTVSDWQKKMSGTNATKMEFSELNATEEMKKFNDLMDQGMNMAKEFESLKKKPSKS